MTFELRPYPYDRLAPLKAIAETHVGGIVDLSVGTPTDAPPAHVIEVLSASGSERGYPPSIGTVGFREAATRWLDRRLGVHIDSESEIAACVGTKEFVASVPHYMKLMNPERDTVLFPAVSYPSYAMGAELAGCRAVPVAVDDQWRIDLASIDPGDVARALMLWVNTPSNPAGAVDKLGAAATWGRAHRVPIFSDECYAEFTWADSPRSILEHGTQGVVAVHSLSKRSNLAGIRAGFFAGDPEIVGWLREIRKHAGHMVPGPVQAAAAAAFDDDAHVELQRDIYRQRLELLINVFGQLGYEVKMPDGAFYLWIAATDGDAWGLVDLLARKGGTLVSPGEFYGEAGAGYVRVAAVAPVAALERFHERMMV